MGRDIGRLIRECCLRFDVDLPLDRRIVPDRGLAFEPSPPIRLVVFFFLDRLPLILGTIDHLNSKFEVGLLFVMNIKISNPMTELLGIIYTENHDRREMEVSRW